jgi:rRNA maturation endonuclease Nob1
MAQGAALEQAVEPPIAEANEALAVCKNCNHLVPKTMVCLYCGTPILFKEPRRPGK